MSVAWPLEMDVDFLVIGAGPAGSVLAMRLAKAGARVALADHGRADVPVVGEFLDAQVIDIMEAIGIHPDMLEGISETAPGITSLWNHPAPLTESFQSRGQRPAVAVERAAFDDVLAHGAKAAGVICLTITDFSFDPASPWRVTLDTDKGHQNIRCRRIIDATGRHAAVARRFHQRPTHYGQLMVTAIWFDAPARFDRALAPLVIETAGNSWWSLSETPGNASVACQYTHKRAWPKSTQITADHALNTLALAPYIAARISKSGATPMIAARFPAHPQRLKSSFGTGWLAIGDAAAAYDPVCGKGTVFAMQSALRASEALLSGNEDDLKEYADAIRFRHDRHLQRRREVYARAGASGRLSSEFLASIDPALDLLTV